MIGVGRLKKNGRPSYSINLKGFLPGLTYMPGETTLHRLHPLIKLELLICYGLMVFALPHYIPGLCLLIILLAAYQAAGMGLTFFLAQAEVHHYIRKLNIFCASYLCP